MVFYFEVSKLVELFAALLTPIVAVFAVYIAWQQKSINKKKYLYEKYKVLVSIYEIVKKCSIGINRHEKISKKNYKKIVNISFDANHFLSKKSRKLFNVIFNSIIRFEEIMHEINNADKLFDISKKLTDEKAVIILRLKIDFTNFNSEIFLELEKINKNKKNGPDMQSLVWAFFYRFSFSISRTFKSEKNLNAPNRT